MCPRCGQSWCDGDVFEAVDPYQEEIYGETVVVEGCKGEFQEWRNDI